MGLNQSNFQGPLKQMTDKKLRQNNVGIHHHHNRFTAILPGPPGWASAKRELLDFYGARED